MDEKGQGVGSSAPAFGPTHPGQGEALPGGGGLAELADLLDAYNLRDERTGPYDHRNSFVGLHDLWLAEAARVIRSEVDPLIRNRAVVEAMEYVLISLSDHIASRRSPK